MGRTIARGLRSEYDVILWRNLLTYSRANFTGMATVTLPEMGKTNRVKSEKGWGCEEYGFEGMRTCWYTLPIVMTPKICSAGVNGTCAG